MPVKALLACLAAPFLLSNAAPRPEFDTPPVIVDMPGIAQVLCEEGRGTAFRTGSHAYTSVDHVTSLTDCTINGEPIKTTWASEELDFSSNRVPTGGQYLTISCEGFKRGQHYVAVGYARGSGGKLRATTVRPAGVVTAAIFGRRGLAVLFGEGRFIPGQSGAPVFDAASGEVVGIASAFSEVDGISYARALSTTPLCKGRV